MSIKKEIRVAINALFLRTKVAGGTETYVTNIVRPWYESGPQGIQFELLANHEPEWWKGDQPWFRLRVIKSSSSIIRRITYEQFWLPLKRSCWDVIFCPGYVGVILACCPQVVTVHDTYAWVLPCEAGRWRTLYWRIMLQLTVRVSSAVVAVSENTKRDLVRFTRVREESVKVITESGDHFHGSAGPTVTSGPIYFIAVGFFKPVKNPERILAAYAEYRRERLSQGKPVCTLRLVGGVFGSEAERIHNLAVRAEGVEIMGRVNDDSLRNLLQGAYGFLFPSLYEGFGIPILEAQRVGCPVLTSSTSSMPEVAGHGALFVDPLQVESIRDGLLQFHEPGVRDHLIDEGFRNAGRFSWYKASSETLELVIECAVKKRRL